MMAYQPTLEDFEQAEKGSASRAARHYEPTIEDFSPQQEGGLFSRALQAAAGGADKFNRAIEGARLPEVAGGILQGGEHAAASVANLPLELVNKLAGTHLNVPYVDLQKYTRQDPTSSAFFKGGEVAGQIIPGATLYGQASKALAPTSVAREMALGAGVGGAVGGSPEDSVKNRLIAAMVGGGLAGVGSLGSRAIARKVLGRKEAVKESFKKEYGDIFSDVKKGGLHNQEMEVPKSLSQAEASPETDFAYKAIPKDYRAPLEKFQEKPTFENAHEAQKELAKFIRKHQSSVESAARSPTGREIPGTKYDAAELAQSLRKSLQEQMEMFLGKNNRLDLINRYKSAGQRYVDEMVPYKNRAIARYEQKLTRPGKFVRELVGEEKFTKPSGQYKTVPGLGARRAMEDSGAATFLRDALKGVGYGVGIGGAIGGLGTLGLPYFANLLRKAQP